MVDMNYVDSSNVEAIGYDPEHSQLYVQFKGGDTYVISDVPQEIYDEFLNAPSKGSFYNRSIKPIYTNISKLS